MQVKQRRSGDKRHRQLPGILKSGGRKTTQSPTTVTGCGTPFTFFIFVPCSSTRAETSILPAIVVSKKDGGTRRCTLVIWSTTRSRSALLSSVANLATGGWLGCCGNLLQRLTESSEFKTVKRTDRHAVTFDGDGREMTSI